ncbi:MAG: matrixin family metalloprotease, partial [Pirellulaceae bacterium]|nr:matrixin family metalloprotease [Pirellulaceae bacterium]
MKLLRKLQIGFISLLFAGGVAAFLQSQWLPDGSEPGLVWDSEGGFAGPEYFDNGKLVFRLITAGTFAIPDEDSNDAVINAFQTWEDVENATIAFSRGSNVTVDTPVESANEHFTIGFTDGAGNTQWGGNLGGATGLATTSFFLTTPKQISDADIAFRTSANFSNDGSTDIDLEATALHEVGHALGVAHSPHAQSEMSYVGSWIGTCQCNTGGRTLTEDDKLVMSLIYPVDGYLATVGTISGTIKKTSDSSNVHMAQIGLFDSNDVLITTSLSDSGTYKIEGVPPGTYTLRAFPTLNSAEEDNLHQSWESLSSLFRDKGAPTDFITTASDDAAGVVVSANTTTSQNLTVADGNSSMTCRFSTFKNGSTTLARTQGIRLKRGQSETVGLIGANMPSVGTLDELSILGGGLVISNFKDEATAPSPAPDFGLLSETIVWDLSVDADANFGSRALVLRNSAHPTERYLVFGYIEIYDEGSATAAAGTENPADSGLGV